MVVAGTLFFVLGEVAPASWCASTRALSGGNGAATAADEVPPPPPCTASGASWSPSIMVALAAGIIRVAVAFIASGGLPHRQLLLLLPRRCLLLRTACIRSDMGLMGKRHF